LHGPAPPLQVAPVRASATNFILDHLDHTDVLALQERTTWAQHIDLRMAPVDQARLKVLCRISGNKRVCRPAALDAIVKRRG
jgi:hypothetical protein